MKKQLIVPSVLLAFSVVPFIGGAVRLASLASGGPVSAENARFFASPIPIVLHIIAATIFSVLGAFQVSEAFRKKHPKWHRQAGHVAAVAGLVVAVSGLWMTVFYPWAEGDGAVVFVARLLAGSGMLLSLERGYTTAMRRDFEAHAAWNLRGYALGMGAATQVLTHLPFFILVGKLDMNQRAFAMASSWVINLVAAELLIQRRRAQKGSRRTLAGTQQQTC